MLVTLLLHSQIGLHTYKAGHVFNQVIISKIVYSSQIPILEVGLCPYFYWNQ